ncbi:MAG: M48 family metallopeptidase, partial [Methylocella sp.]
TSAKHSVTLKLSSALEIAEEGGFLTAWAYGDIRRADGPKDVLRLRNIAAAKLARLEIRDSAAQAEVLRLCTMLDGEGAAGNVSTARIVVWSLAAAASLLAVIWFGVPLVAARLTGLVPLSLEKRLGDAADRRVHAIFRGKSCAGPKGTAALAKLVGALQAKAQLRLPPEPSVLASPIPNAFALPGGKVYVLNGLLEKAESPDELAGVLAHEFGHVAHRDGLRRLIEDSGTGFLVGLLFGDITGASVVLGAGRGLLSAAYSRDAEANADQYARALMQKLGRSPKPLGDLLLRISGPEKDNPLAIFASHPMTADRLAMLEAASSEPTGAPLLLPDEWRALKAICK